MADQADRKSVKSDALPQEMPAVRTTIVGGRPPGSGKTVGAIPRGIEVLVKKAVVDSQFRALLLAKRSGAAESIGLSLNPAEVMMLDIVPAAHLESIIAQTRVEPTVRPAFLGKAAAVMLVALGAGTYSAYGQTVQDGVRAERPAASAPADPQAQPAPAPEQREMAGVRANVPNGLIAIKTKPQPASQPTTQPTSIPALSAADAAKIDTLIKKLDSEQYTDREAAQKELLDIGVSALPTLQGKAADQSLSLEVRSRLDTIVGKLKATTKPVGPGDIRPVRGIRVSAGIMVAPPPEEQ